MGNLNGFNAGDHKDAGRTDFIRGDYEVIIVDSVVKPTKAMNGNYLEFKFQVLTGQYQNRYLWSRLNIDNPSEKAVAIAKGQLSKICRAVNRLTINDSSELHGGILKVTLKIKANGDYEVTDYKPRHNGGSQAVSPTAQPTAPAGQTTQLMTQPSAPPAMTGGAPRSPFA